MESRLPLGPAMKLSVHYRMCRIFQTGMTRSGVDERRKIQVANGNCNRKRRCMNHRRGTFRRPKSMAARCGLASICAPACGVEKKDACILAFTKEGRLKSRKLLYRMFKLPCSGMYCTVLYCTVLYCTVLLLASSQGCCGVYANAEVNPTLKHTTSVHD